MPETAIRPAFAAQELAAPLIAEHHEHLEDARILWLFTTAKRTRGGRVVLGTAGRTNALQRYLSSGNESVQTGFDFIVLIEDKRWQTSLATQRKALVDHLLCRMIQHEVVNKATGNTTHSWGTVTPDVEEFTDVILRHGVWLPEQQVFAKAIVNMPGRQLTLHMPDPRVDAEPAGDGKPPDRVTTVDGEGAVVTTERIAPTDDDHERKNRETAERLAAQTPGSNGSTEHEPGWQEQAGLGETEHEQRRRGRAKANV